MLDKFLKYLEAEKQYSKLTIRAYGDDIRQFLLYYGAEEMGFEPKDVSHIDIRSWIMSLVESGDKSSTVNRKVSALRSFFRYMLRRGIIPKDPLSKIGSLKRPERIPTFVEKSRMQRFETMLEPCTDYCAERKSLIVILFYVTGIRLAELLGIKIDDISFEELEIKITGKGDKQRMVPLSPAIAERLKNFVELRAKICLSDKKFLFLSDKGEATSRTEVYKLVHDVLTLMGVEGKKSPHVLRHTFATHLLNEGVGIETVKELLGHANLITTQCYTHSTIDELLKSYQKAHPHAKKG